MTIQRIISHNKLSLKLIAFTAPALIFIFAFIFVPFFMTIFYSFTNWDGIREAEFVGFDNYRRFVDDHNAINSLTFTLRYAAVYVVSINVLSLLLASLINSKIVGKDFFRTAFYVPNVISLVIIGFIWQFILRNVFDSLYIMSDESLAFLQWSWLGDKDLAFYSVILVTIWQSIGFFTIVYYAALQSVPGDLLEAASIDGAGSIRRFFRITVPMIMPTITFCVFFAIANSFKQFDLIFSLTDGGPGGATTTMALDIFRTGFGTLRQLGYGNAKSVILFVLVAVITALQISLFRRKEVEL